jgi:16S rRNA processing protein RimM
MPVDSDRADLPFGVVVRPHGVRGALLVRAFNADTDRVVPGARFRLIPKDGQGTARDAEIDKARPSSGEGRFVVELSGLSGRDAAEELRGWRLVLPAGELDLPAPDEFYYAEAVGFSVWTEEGACLGQVTTIFEAGNDLIVVRPTHDRPATAPEEGTAPPTGEWILPVLREILLEVDHEARRFVVRIPEGLEPEPLELAPGKRGRRA